MNYFKIKTIGSTPFLQFELFAESTKELEDKGYTRSSPYIASQDVMEGIEMGFGRFLKKLDESGYLINLSEGELSALEASYKPITKSNLRAQLMSLSIEIDLATRMSESTTNLQNEFDSLKEDYDGIVIT